VKSDNKFKISDIIDRLGDIKYIKELFNVLRNKKVSIAKKSMILILLLLMTVYIISPLDILPDLVPGFGLIEDLLVGVTMLAFIGGLIEKELSRAKPEDAFITKTGKSKIVDFKVKVSPNKKDDNTKDDKK